MELFLAIVGTVIAGLIITTFIISLRLLQRDNSTDFKLLKADFESVKQLAYGMNQSVNEIGKLSSNIVLLANDIRQHVDLTSRNTIVSTTWIQDILKRVSIQEQILHQLLMGRAQFSAASPPIETQSTYATADGSITAGSVEELLEKINKKRLEQLDNRERTEEDIQGLFEADEDTPSGDSDDDKEEWQK